MTDWNEFIEDETWHAYRKHTVELVAKHVAALLNHVAHKPESAAELKGALDMAYKILGLPATLTTDVKLQARYHELVQQDMAGVAAVILQRRFEG